MLAEWQAKTVSLFVAAQAGLGLVDWGKKDNPLVEAVRAISIDGSGGRELTPQEKELEEMRGPVVAADYRDDPRLNRQSSPDLDRMVQYGPAADDALPAWVFEGDVDAAAGNNRSGSYEALRAGWGGGGKTAFEVPEERAARGG